jgi:outer membrane protein OmpA-like peptidoglycan-associated protein
MTREDGVVVQVPVQKVDELIQIGTSDFNMALTPAPGAVSYENSNIVLKTESTALVTGVGFQPGSTVEVWLFSTPRLLGTAVVKADGTFSVSVPVPGDISVGQHTLQAEGLNAAGQPRAVSAGVTVSRDMFLGSTTRVQFSSNSSYLNWASKAALNAFASKAKAAGAKTITITGHTDSLGKSSSNTKLSRNRANAVAAYLKTKLKGSGITVTVSYKGKDAPAASNSTKAGRATNRRADIVPS